MTDERWRDPRPFDHETLGSWIDRIICHAPSSYVYASAEYRAAVYGGADGLARRAWFEVSRPFSELQTVPGAKLFSSFAP